MIDIIDRRNVVQYARTKTMPDLTGQDYYIELDSTLPQERQRAIDSRMRRYNRTPQVRLSLQSQIISRPSRASRKR